MFCLEKLKKEVTEKREKRYINFNDHSALPVFISSDVRALLLIRPSLVIIGWYYYLSQVWDPTVDPAPAALLFSAVMAKVRYTSLFSSHLFFM
jgi:hypothetical protein